MTATDVEQSGSVFEGPGPNPVQVQLAAPCTVVGGQGLIFEASSASFVGTAPPTLA